MLHFDVIITNNVQKNIRDVNISKTALSLIASDTVCTTFDQYHFFHVYFHQHNDFEWLAKKNVNYVPAVFYSCKWNGISLTSTKIGLFSTHKSTQIKALHTLTKWISSIYQGALFAIQSTDYVWWTEQLVLEYIRSDNGIWAAFPLKCIQMTDTLKHSFK